MDNQAIGRALRVARATTGDRQQIIQHALAHLDRAHAVEPDTLSRMISLRKRDADVIEEVFLSVAIDAKARLARIIAAKT